MPTGDGVRLLSIRKVEGSAERLNGDSRELDRTFRIDSTSMINSNVMRIYVAGPYSGTNPSQVEHNIRTAVAAGVEIIRRGHYPYIPHLTHYVDLVRDTTLHLSWEDHLDWGLAWLDKADALLYLAPSRGANIELDYATRNNKQIFRAVDDIPVLSSRRHYVDGPLSGS